MKLFDLLSPEELEKINQKHYEVQFNARETIFKQGTSFTHIICITSGLVKAYIEGYNKKNFIIRLVKAGDMVAGPGMFTDYRHHFSVAAIEESSACFIDVNVFQEIILNNTKLAFELLKRSHSRDIFHFDKFITLTQKQMPGRVADTLMYLYKEIYLTNPFYLTLTRQDLAELASMTKESVIRILKEFKDAGFISINGNEVKILNEKVLVNISENG
jgi:CRP-like cAMP-binding protein